MALTRRGFFAAFPLSALAASVEASPKPPDSEHVIHGWRVRWSGWREPANQLVRVGFWFAVPPESFQPADGDRRGICCTTTGEMQRVQDVSVINFARFDSSWPVSVLESDAKFEQAKIRAYRAVELWIRKRA